MKQEGSLILLSRLLNSRPSFFFMHIKTSIVLTILRQRALNGKTNSVDSVEQVRVRERGYAIPAPEANAEIQTNLDVCDMFFLCLFAPPYLPTSQFLCY
jgi:hypothetical protein